MKTQEINPQERRRKFLLVLPILTLPFILVFVWAFCSKKNETGIYKPDNKVNMALPEASFNKERPQDKMSFYAQAVTDSNKRNEQSLNDPYANSAPGHAGNEANFNAYGTQGYAPSFYGNQGYAGPTEAKIYSKLGELNTALNQPSPPAAPPYSYMPTSSGNAVSSADMDRLENMMNMMQQGSPKDDSEMQQINSVLEKIMDIQHPELAQDKLKASRNQAHGKTYAVTSKTDESPVTMLSGKSKVSKTVGPGFYSLSESQQDPQNNTIAAVIHDNQTIVSGSIVKMRLANDIMVRGELVPKDIFVFGQAQINGERLKIEIKSIRYNNSIYPVNLTVCDLDGMDGIHIPGAITRDIAKENSTDALQGLGINSFEPSLATQAASAGIEMGKNLIKKKVKLVKVTLKAGYRLLLKDDKQEEFN